MINFKSSHSEILSEYNCLLKDSSIPELDNWHKPIYKKSILKIHDLILNESLKNSKTIVFAIDSISFKYFITELINFIENDSKIAPITSMFPSTTNTAWSSIITWLPPSKHWMVSVSFKNNSPKGSYVWLNDKIKDNNWNIYKVSSSVNIFNDRLKNIFLKSLGNHTYYWKHWLIELNWENTLLHSFLSKWAKIHNPNMSWKDYFDLNKIFEDVKSHISNIINLKSKWIDWVYIDIDTYIHKFWYTNELTTWFFKEFFSLFYNLKKLWAKIIICSDHWQIEQWKIEDSIFKMSKLNKNLDIPVSWAWRTLFFYPKLGKHKDVKIWLKSIIWDKWRILTKKECVNLWILSVQELKSDKIWDIVVIANKKWFPSTWPDSLFEHGWLSSDEMIVPVILL